MTISRTQCGLQAGTVLRCNTGWIILTSNYNDYRECYEYRDVEIDESGNVKELSTGGYIAPRKLLGAEIF